MKLSKNILLNCKVMNNIQLFNTLKDLRGIKK